MIKGAIFDVDGTLVELKTTGLRKKSEGIRKNWSVYARRNVIE